MGWFVALAVCLLAYALAVLPFRLFAWLERQPWLDGWLERFGFCLVFGLVWAGVWLI
jgi:hypothetical protein